MKRLGILVIVVGLLSGALSAPASATLTGAKPAPGTSTGANFTAAAAISIKALPFSTSESTGAAPAGTDAVDCAGNGSAVWFAFRLQTPLTIDADTLGSNYDTTLSAYTGSPGRLTQIACNDDAAGIGLQSEILFDVPARQTVYLMAASFGGGPGGDLRISVTTTTNRAVHGCGLGHAQSSRNRCASTTPYFLAVGDSAPVWNGGQSYPDQILRSKVTKHVRGLKLVKTACSSETSDSFIGFSLCGGSQLQRAVDFLTTNRGNVALATIDIGGNDVLPCASLAGVDWNCASAVFASMQANVRTILSELRAAAGPNVPIYAMNYYNPFLGYDLLGPSARPLVLQTVLGQVALNARLEEVYREFRVPVADVQDAFQSTDLQQLVTSPWGTVPVAVERACTLLDITCIRGQLEIFGDDPNVDGATLIAETFEKLIGRVDMPR